MTRWWAASHPTTVSSPNTAPPLSAHDKHESSNGKHASARESVESHIDCFVFVFCP